MDPFNIRGCRYNTLNMKERKESWMINYYLTIIVIIIKIGTQSPYTLQVRALNYQSDPLQMKATYSLQSDTFYLQQIEFSPIVVDSAWYFECFFLSRYYFVTHIIPVNLSVLIFLLYITIQNSNKRYLSTQLCF